LAVLVGAGWYVRKHETLDPSAVFSLVDSYPVIGPVVFVVCYAIAVLTALPTIPFNLAAGLFWGPIAGGIFSAVGTTLGAVGAFTMARSVFGRLLTSRFDNKMIAEIQREFDDKSWKFVAFMRLNPVFPTGPLNYILGLTSISAFTYVWVTFVFLVPSSIMVAYIGYSMGTFVVTGDVASALKMILTVSAAGTALVGIAVGARLLNRVRRNDPAPCDGSGLETVAERPGIHRGAPTNS
jgi:uncharacterized membrane protein YdjX (TVP38/TMEM64 family)